MKRTMSLVLLISFFCINAFAVESSVDIHLRPSYQETLKACKANTEEYKQNAYKQAFLSGLHDFLEATTLTTQGIATILSHRGISTYVYENLYEMDTTWPALVDCMQESQARNFAYLLNLSDGTGKAAGLTITLAGFKIVTGLSKAVSSSLNAISPILARKATFYATIASSAYASYMIQKKINEYQATKIEAAKIKATTPTFENDFKREMSDTASQNISAIEKQLADPNLSEDDRAQAEKELHNWQIVFKKFAA
jgi:hypothetical protein